MSINKKLSAIQVELKVGKTRKNNFGNYMFRSAEDILEALKPYMKKHGVNVTTDEDVVGEGLLKSTACLTDNESGESICKSAVVGVEIMQKGMMAPQRWGAASSYGKKYALGNLFLIDDTQDADATNNHDQGPRNAIHQAKKENTSSIPSEWLNPGTPLWDKVKNKIDAGETTLEEVMKHYAVSKANQDKLK